jgi:hypothetical protein
VSGSAILFVGGIRPVISIGVACPPRNFATEPFSELRRSVQLRYQETVDVKEFEPKIQKLLDDHVVASPAETIIELVNINDPDAL